MKVDLSPSNDIEFRSLQVRAVTAESKLQQMQIEIDNLRSRVICTRKDQQAIQTRGKVRLVELLGDNYKLNKRKGFSQLWRDYKLHLKPIRSYRDTLERDYDAGIKFIERWMPNDTTLLLEASKCLLCDDELGTIEVDGSLICKECNDLMSDSITG